MGFGNAWEGDVVRRLWWGMGHMAREASGLVGFLSRAVAHATCDGWSGAGGSWDMRFW